DVAAGAEVLGWRGRHTHADVDVAAEGVTGEVAGQPREVQPLAISGFDAPVDHGRDRVDQALLQPETRVLEARAVAGRDAGPAGRVLVDAPDRGGKRRIGARRPDRVAYLAHGGGHLAPAVLVVRERRLSHSCGLVRRHRLRI